MQNKSPQNTNQNLRIKNTTADEFNLNEALRDDEMLLQIAEKIFNIKNIDTANLQLVLSEKTSENLITRFIKKENFPSISKEQSKEREDMFYKIGEKFSGFNCAPSKVRSIVNQFFDCNHLSLLGHFINKFKIIDNRYISENLMSTIEKILLEWQLNPLKTHVVDLSKPNSSEQKLSQYLFEKINTYLLNDKTNKMIQTFVQSDQNQLIRDFKSISFGVSYHHIQNGFTALFFLPFLSDVENLLHRIKIYKEKIQVRGITDIKFKFLSFATMETNRERLEESEMDVFILDYLPKGISDYYSDEEIPKIIQSICDMEEKRLSKTGRKHYNYPLGYKNSEALYAIKNFGVPKNVFQIFWCDANGDNTNLLRSF